MEVIHRGFDKLDVAFKSNIPKSLVSKLETTKEQSRLLRQKATASPAQTPTVPAGRSMSFGES